MSFKKIIIIVLFTVILPQVVFSQITYGKITYERKTNLWKKFKHNGDVKEWLKEEDKNKIDMFELYFNDSLSVFKPQESDLAERMSWATSKNVVYQNYKTNYRLTEKKIWGEGFTVVDTVRQFNWKMTDSKRSICGYQCRKAIWQANDSTRIYAWFCSEIIPSIGPESFVGLPGAILGLATEDGGVIYFAKSVEIVKPETTTLLPKKTKQKIYKAAELKAQLEKDFGKEKWGKAMIYNQFAIW
ncbi:MAG: GLPGLI family protein [Bacteroidia bacterium]|nr:GLPGLI family protein [Bacteroidia bacterium]